MSVALAVLALLLGGVMKGATGAGAPMIAAPALTMLFNVQTAVAILVVPNLLSNIWQAWSFRRSALPRRFLIFFAGGGLVGAVLGTWLLVILAQETLALMVAVAVIAYIALRLGKPDWVLASSRAEGLSAPVGLVGGLLQGATGVSAPASITFLNAMRLPRAAFIGTIAIFFVAISTAQLPALWTVGLISMQTVVLGLIALALILLGMPLGNWLGKRCPPKVFDAVLLTLLGVIAAKILIEAMFSF